MSKLKDESNVLEYKLTLPEDSINWLKTIVSFSNTSGGELVLGVEGSTKTVVGIDGYRSELESRIMDSIYNNVVPTPIVNIVFRNIEDKDILVVQVSKGNQYPYYIKSQGMIEGTFVRFGSTYRKATHAQIGEMQLGSKKLSFSTMIHNNKLNNSPYLISNDELSEFLDRINSKSKDKPINENKLLEWELIDKNFDELVATNGYMLLNSNPFNYSYIKIGFFDGTNKVNLIHDEEFHGSIIEQYENCIHRLKEILNEGFIFKAVRSRKYSVPEEVIREIMANAIIHRDYNDEHPIRVEIFSDRLCIFSPGPLYDGLQLEEILSGVSKLRNRNIAEIFHSLGFIEKWGSGISRANQVLSENDMNPLSIDTQSIHGVTVTILFERGLPKKSVYKGNTPSSKEVINIFRNLNTTNFKRLDLQEQFNITERQARTLLEDLVKKQLVRKTGAGPSTRYVVTNDSYQS